MDRVCRKTGKGCIILLEHWRVYDDNEESNFHFHHNNNRHEKDSRREGGILADKNTSTFNNRHNNIISIIQKWYQNNNNLHQYLPFYQHDMIKLILQEISMIPENVDACIFKK